MMKNLKNCPIFFFIALRKCPDALNATQKPPAHDKVVFLEKSRKNSKNTHFNQNGPKRQVCKYFFINHPCE